MAVPKKKRSRSICKSRRKLIIINLKKKLTNTRIQSKDFFNILKREIIKKKVLNCPKNIKFLLNVYSNYSYIKKGFLVKKIRFNKNWVFKTYYYKKKNITWGQKPLIKMWTGFLF